MCIQAQCTCGLLKAGLSEALGMESVPESCGFWIFLLIAAA